jgi:hypothetical protein
MQQLSTDDRDIIAKVRNVFSSRTGQEVLNWILADCGMFNQIPTTAEAVALRNWAVKLVTMLGGGGISKENVADFTLRLMKQPMFSEEVEDGLGEGTPTGKG